MKLCARMGDAGKRLIAAAQEMRRYVYRWNRQGRKGQICTVTARGTMNSCRVLFEDGYSMVTSRNTLRKVKSDV